jgi:hypothetical protein
VRPKATQNPESVVKEIKGNTRRKFNSEEKIRNTLEGLRGEDSIANICRKEGIAPSIYCKWRKAYIWFSMWGILWGIYFLSLKNGLSFSLNPLIFLI